MFSTLHLIKTSQTPLYLQLANGLARFIENGQLYPGTKLPSIRSLAKKLKINRDTVVSAYKTLEQRGFTYGKTGSGTYVSTLPIADAFSPIDTLSFANKNLINFSTVTLPEDHCPIEVFEGISSRLLLEENWDAFYDPGGQKHQLLLDEVCQYFKEYQLKTTPNQIRIIKSLPQLLHSLPKSTSRPGICIESPCKHISLFQKYGFKSFEIPLESDGMNIDILENHLQSGKIQYIYVTPYLQNPTGICYSSQKKHQLLALAKKYNVYIIEEDTYSDLLKKDIDYTSIYSYFENNHVIYIKNFSALYLPKLNYSFIALPTPLKDIKVKHSPHTFMDSFFYHYLRDHIWQQSQIFLINYYQDKYHRLLNLIDTYLVPHVSYSSCWGGIYIWLRIESPYITAQTLCNKLLGQHVIINPGTLFYTDKNTSSHIRISIAQVSMTQIEKGVKVIASLF